MPLDSHIIDLHTMKITYVYIALVVLALGGIVFVRSQTNGAMGESTTQYDSFAECISNTGAKFYGAFWCPHCQDQKKLFDNSKKLPYVECSTPDGKGRTQACIDANITGYPTWVMGDGTILDGVQQFSTLAEKTACPIPTS